MTFSPGPYLRSLGSVEDGAIDLGLAALAFCAPDHEGISTDRYTHHLSMLKKDVEARFHKLREGGAADDAGTRLAALKHILADREGYAGDEESYDDLQNADLMRVIDRRKGLPVALAILYLCIGRRCGFTVEGLDFPGHFLCRIEEGGTRLIFDPFDRCAVMEAPQLRALIKKIYGSDAELSTDYYQSVTNREILIRLQNNIKLRLIEAGDYAAALKHVERMRQADPAEYRLLLDAGVLYAKTGRKKAAIEVLEAYMDSPADWLDRQDAALILRQLRED